MLHVFLLLQNCSICLRPPTGDYHCSRNQTAPTTFVRLTRLNKIGANMCRCFARNTYSWNDRHWPHLSRCHSCNCASKGLLGQCKMIGQHLKSAQVKSERGGFAAHSCGWSRDCRNPWRPVECRTMQTVTSTMGMVMVMSLSAVLNNW